MDRARERGVTALEIVVVVAVIGSIAGALGRVGLAGSDLFRTAMVKTRMESTALSVVDRMVAEATTARLASLDAFPPSVYWRDRITMDVLESVSGSSMTPSWRFVHFEWRPGQSEAGATLTDDGRVVVTRNYGTPAAEEIILCTGVNDYLEGEVPNGKDDNGNGLVDERGFCVERRDSWITFHLTLRRKDETGNCHLQTLTGSLSLRN